MSARAVVLLIEDNPADARLIREMLRDTEDSVFGIEIADTLRSGLARLAVGNVAVVLLDLNLPDSQGLDTFMRAHAQAPDVPIVLLSGLGDELMAMHAVGSGAQDYLIKDRVDGVLLVRTMRYAIERKRTEVELRRAWQYARSLIEASLDPLVTISPRGVITDVNRATEEATGVPRERLIGSDFSNYFTEPQKAREGYQQVIAEGLVRDYPLTIRHVSGRAMDVLYNATVYRNELGELQGVFAAARDVTERNRAEIALQRAYAGLEQRVAERTAALRTSNEALSKEVVERTRAEEQLRILNETLEQRVAERTAIAEQRAAQLSALTSELTQAEQRERRRLAQLLHDHLQQLLVAAKLQVVAVQRRAQSEALQDSLQHVRDLLDQSIQASRSLTVELSPPVLYDLGLGPALFWLARWMQEAHGLTVEVLTESQGDAISEDIRVLLFQTIRELLFNVVKHAQVDRATVRMRELSGGQVHIVVRDAGIGFDPARLHAGESVSGGFGLFSVRDRLESLGGQVEIDSAPGCGTCITLCAPVHSSLGAVAVPLSLADRPPRAPESAAVLPHDVPTDHHPRIRVLLADDRQIVREGLASLLREYQDIEVVAEAVDGQMAVELARQVHPDVVIMDVTMPRLNGIEATRIITAELPRTRVIGLSMHQELDLAVTMRQAGATAYLTKDGPFDILLAAIRGEPDPSASAASS